MRAAKVVTRFGREFVATLHLVRIEGNAGDAALQKAAQIAHGATNTASDIEDVIVPGLDGEVTAEVIFVATNRLVKGFARVLVAEMKARTPAPFVKDRGEIVVRVDQGLVGLIFRVGAFFLVKLRVIVDSLIDRFRSAQSIFLCR